MLEICVAQAQAQAAAERLSSGCSLGDLDGCILAVKDNFCVKGSVTTCASAALQNFQPCYTATAVSKLQNAGCIVIGKTNLDEFGMGSFNLNSVSGHVTNPYPKEAKSSSKSNVTYTNELANQRVSGGSSGGSAVAVASGCCDIALGSDTGGSVRIPAAYCGVIGYKPSYGTARLVYLVYCGE